MKMQINFRASEKTQRQLVQLMEWWGETQTATLAVIIDRIYQEEFNRRKAKNERQNRQDV